MNLSNILLEISNKHPFLFWLNIGCIGLVIGSFLNVVIYRLPIILGKKYQQEILENLPDLAIDSMSVPNSTYNLAIPSSHCPQCKTPLTWWQNIPIIGFLVLSGKCATCRKPIAWRYPLVEILTSLTTVWVVIVMHFGIDNKTLPMLVLTWALIAAIGIDAEQQLLPDCLTLPLVWIGLLVNANYIFTTPSNAIFGASSAYLFLWSIVLVFRLLRNTEGMGYGDFKLFAVFGAWLGWQLLPLIITTASIAAAVVGIFLVLSKKHIFKQPLPFGPYLATVGWCGCLYGQEIMLWCKYYLSI